MAILLTVIIPTCNRNDMLAQCLALLAPGKQTLPATAYEVVVSDDGAGIGAEEICINQYPWVHYTRGPRRGPAANRNHGASMALGTWLVFIDDDCMPQTDLLKQYGTTISAYPTARAFEGAILPDEPEKLGKDMAECPVNTNGGCFWSANIMVEKAIFRQLGGFDERFPMAANEDQMLYTTLKTITVVPFAAGARVVHPVRIRSLADKLSKLPTSEFSQALLDRLHGKSPWQVYLNGLRIHSLGAIMNLRHGHIKRCAYNIAGTLYRLFFWNPFFAKNN